MGYEKFGNRPGYPGKRKGYGMTWQPIETAPKDGTAILLFPGELTWTDEMAPVTGWYARGSLKWVSHSRWLSPTHWLPLPQPPEVTE